jgi:serine/threonine-protein kinase
MLASNTILKDRYRIIQPLGRGGMGAVYQALDEGHNRLVAVKETFATTDELRRAFRREAELLGNLQHPALPFVIEHFREGSGQFLVMQFIDGNNFEELLRLREQPFAVERVLEWADQLLDVLEEMHGNEPAVIHRDIKPSNLKLTSKGKIILLDFGLAKGFAGDMSTLEKGESLSSFPAYTRRYSPLEQLQGAGTDPRCDLYSLGATLWTLLTNALPSDALTRIAELGQGNADPLRLAHVLNPKVPPAVSEVLCQAMSIYRHARPDSAVDMRRMLREAANGAGVTLAEGEGRGRLVEARREQAHTQHDDARILAPGAGQRVAEDKGGRHETEATPNGRRAGGDKVAAVPVNEQRERPPAAGSKPVATPAAPSSATVPDDEMTVSNVHTPGNSMQSKPVLFATSPAAPSSSSFGFKGSRRARFAALLALALVIAIGLLIWLGRQPGSGHNSNLAVAGEQQSGRPAGGATASTPTEPPPAPASQTSETALPKTAPLSPEPPGMVYVPGGTFTMGRNKSDGGDEYEHPAHQVTVGPFFIDQYEVTNEDYEKFVREKNWPPPSTWEGRKTYLAGAAHKPVTGVKWDDAVAYAKWAGKRLPTEEEWEFAARGGIKEFRYPWNNRWKDGLANANSASGGLAEVGSYKGASPFGAFDMVGNAWEWTDSKLTLYPGGRLPVKVSDDLKVIRGGSFESNRDQATTTYRRGWRASAESDYSKTGFRCVKDIGGS